MLSVVWGLRWVVTSIERTAYPRFKRLITAHELHLFFSPSRDELEWAADATDCDEHLLALLLMLKSYRRMGCFPALEDVPEMVVDFVRRAVELPESTLPVYRAERTAKHHRGLVRKQAGVTYDQAKARGIVEQSIRKEAAAKNRPADLINIALEKVVEAGLELPGFSTFDKMASKIRTEVNASICTGIHDRMSAAQRAGLMRLLEERDSDGTTLFNRLKKPAKGPTWSHFKNLTKRLEWLDELGDTDVWMDGVAAGKVTDFAGEADAADASELRDFVPVKRIALVAALTHKARMRVRDDLATMFCKRVATKIKKAKAELEEIRLAEREIVEALIGNYRTVLKHIDEGGPAQEALTKAAAMTAEVRQALDGLDEEAPVDEVATRLEGRVSPAVLTLVQAQVVQAGGFGAVTRAVDGFGGFAKQYEQIEKVSAHHGNFWEVLLYGQIGRDRAVMFDLADNDKLKFTATSEDSRVLDALAHAQRHQAARGEYITAFNEEGKKVDISFATQNWRKAVVDKTRTGQFVRKHFEAMVFTALAEELRTGDVAVVGSEEYADWSEQLLAWEAVQETLESYLVEVGLAEPGESAEFDAKSFRRQLEDKLRGAAAAADAGYPENDGLVIDPETGIPSLKAFRADGQRPSAKRLEQEIKARMPERSLMGIVARTAYWVEWWRRFGPPSGNEPKLTDPLGRYVIVTFVKGTNMGPYEAARHIPRRERARAVVRRQQALLDSAAERGGRRPGERARPPGHLAGVGGWDRGGGGRHPHGYLSRQPALRDEREVRQAGRHRLPPRLGHLHRAVHTLHPVRGVGGRLHHRGPAEEYVRGAADHRARGYAGPELPCLRARPPAGLRPDAQDQELEGTDLLPALQAQRVRAHRRPVRRAGQERHRLRLDRVPVPPPDAGGRLRPRGHHLLLHPAQAPALGVEEERHLRRLPRGRPRDPHRPATALPRRRAAAPAGDRSDQQGGVVQPVLPVDRLRQPRRHRRQRPHRAREGDEVQRPAHERGDLPQRPGHRGDRAPAP